VVNKINFSNLLPVTSVVLLSATAPILPSYASRESVTVGNQNINVGVALLASKPNGSRVRRVSATDALEGRVDLIVNFEGGGIILDFSPLGEVIRQISLDDPSRLVYDSCLLKNNCGGQPSPTVRLFRSRGIRFPDLPAAKETLLTIQTTDSRGEWQTYIFRVRAGNGVATYNKVLVGATTISQNPSAGNTRSESVQQIRAGLLAAKNQSTLVDPALKGRLAEFLTLLDGGVEPHIAARRLGVSMNVINKLQELGQKIQMAQTTPVAIPSPSPQPSPSSQPSSAKKPKTPTSNPSPQPNVPAAAENPPALATPPMPQTTSQPSPSSTTEQTPRPNLPKQEGTKPALVPQSTNSSPSPIPVVSAMPTPAPVSTPSSSLPSGSKLKPHQYAAALVRGANRARVAGLLNFGSSSWWNINSAVVTLRQGSSLRAAYRVSRMTPEKFLKLLADGGITADRQELGL
jgi:hypothetical protein